MLTEVAIPNGMEVTVLDHTDPPCPAAQVGARQMIGNLGDADLISKLASGARVTTWEIEHVNAEALIAQVELGRDVQPSPYTLKILQNKLSQKKFLDKAGIPVPSYREIKSSSDLEKAVEELGPVIVKRQTGGYDGLGNLALNSANWEEIDKFSEGAGIYAEKALELKTELSVIMAVARSRRRVTYPVIETEQKDGICELAVAPARIPHTKALEATEIGQETVSLLHGAGVFAVEMFLTTDDEILVNEIAPRVHNSGHLTIEGHATSQFEQHIRAIMGLPLGPIDTLAPAAAMANIIGPRDGPVDMAGLRRILTHRDIHVHMYGKRTAPRRRKMGHLTVRAETADKAIELAITARKEISR
jgi:phosphoribosylaminoimidazole carboxylase PurK protein